MGAARVADVSTTGLDPAMMQVPSGVPSSLMLSLYA